MSTWNKYSYFLILVFSESESSQRNVFTLQVFLFGLRKEIFLLTLREILCTLNSQDIGSNFPIIAMYLIIDLPTINISYKTCGYDKANFCAVFTIPRSGYSALTSIQQTATDILLVA
jgi:hypothetical protein